jgi:hypothetical protein
MGDSGEENEHCEYTDHGRPPEQGNPVPSDAFLKHNPATISGCNLLSRSAQSSLCGEWCCVPRVHTNAKAPPEPAGLFRLFPARRFSRGLRLALGRFLLFFQAGLLSTLLVGGLVLTAVVLNNSGFFCHAGQSRVTWDVPGNE